MLNRSRRALSLLALFLAIGPLSIGGVFAQSVTPTPQTETLPEFSVTAESEAGAPVSTETGFFIFELDADSSGEAAVGIINSDPERDLYVELNIVDAITSQGGGAAYSETGHPVSGVGTWIDVTDDTVTVPAGQAGLVFFTVKVPDDAAPGQYLAGISIWHDLEAYEGTPEADGTNSTTGTQAGVQIRSRYVLPVQINVPGDWTSELAVNGAGVLVRASGAWVIVDLENTGTTFLHPTGTFTLTDHSTGDVVMTEQVMMDTFVTNSTSQLWFTLPDGAVPGTYDIVLDLTFEGDQTVHFEATVEAAEDQG